jgi:hypothetical protein
MRSDQTSEDITLTDVPITRTTSEKKTSQPDKKRRKSQKLLDSLTSRVEELLRIKDDLQQTIVVSDADKQLGGEKTTKTSVGERPDEDTIVEPELNYRLSSLLDFLRQLHGFKDCGVFLLKEENAALETLVLSPGPTGYEDIQNFEDGVNERWRSGHIRQAIDEKKRVVLPTKDEGSFLVVPFKVLDEKDGFWVAHFRTSVPLEKKSCEELLSWTDLITSCVENYCLKQLFQSPQSEIGTHADSEKLFSTVQLTRAMVHETNNSLQVILGRSQLLKMDERKSSSASPKIKNLETIETSCNQACSVLKNFSDYLHRQFDEITDSGEVNLHHILKSNLVLIEYLLKSKQIKLNLDFGEDLPLVSGNPGELEQAFLVLFWEIKDLLASGGSVLLTMSAKKDMLHLVMSCKAKGHLEHEGTDFADLESRSRLKTVSKALTKHGGELNVEKPEDLQIRFELRFPITLKSKDSTKGSTG